MAVAKYNWEEIKQKYFESDIIEVREFLLSFLSVNPKTAGNGSYAKATKGWRDEKEALTKKLKQNAFENNKDEQVQKEVAELLNLCLAGEKLVLLSIFKRVKENKEALPMSELRVALDAFLLGAGKPNVVSQNNNNNKDVDKQDEIEAMNRLAKALEAESKETKKS